MKKGIRFPWENWEFPNQILTFELGGKVYGIDILKVREVIRCIPISCPPGEGPGYLVGTIHLRGQLTPVINLARILGVDDVSQKDCNRMVAAQVNDLTCCFLVENVTGIVSCRFDELDLNTGEGPVADNLSCEVNGGITLLELHKLIPSDQIDKIKEILYRSAEV